MLSGFSVVLHHETDRTGDHVNYEYEMRGTMLYDLHRVIDKFSNNSGSSNFTLCGALELEAIHHARLP